MNIATGSDLTSALIDLITSLVLIPFCILLSKKEGPKRLKVLWTMFLSLLSVSNFIGFAIHFLILDELIVDIIWIFLYAFIYLLVLSFLAISIINFSKKTELDKRWVIPAIIVSACTYIASVIVSFKTVREIRILVVYAAIFVLTAIVFYAIYGIRDKKKSALILSFIVIPQLFGLYFQLTKNVCFSIGEAEFDHNGIYHSMLLISVVIFYFVGKSNLKEWNSNNGN